MARFRSPDDEGWRSLDIWPLSIGYGLKYLYASQGNGNHRRLSFHFYVAEGGSVISKNARLSICVIPLECLQVTEFVSCFPEKVMQYTKLLKEHPGEYMEPMMVTPSPLYPRLFVIKNGKHRYISYILAERTNALCVVIEE